MKKFLSRVKRFLSVWFVACVCLMLGVSLGINGLGMIGKLKGIPDLNGIAYATFTPPTVETENILLIAGAVFTALAAIWFVKKGIKLLNRS